MTTPGAARTCSRLFQVEALRDGRLEGAERKSFERHLAGCAVCAHEAEEMEKLASREQMAQWAEACTNNDEVQRVWELGRVPSAKKFANQR